jgi:hypothetical protein
MTALAVVACAVLIPVYARFGETPEDASSFIHDTSITRFIDNDEDPVYWIPAAITAFFCFAIISCALYWQHTPLVTSLYSWQQMQNTLATYEEAHPRIGNVTWRDPSSSTGANDLQIVAPTMPFVKTLVKDMQSSVGFMNSGTFVPLFYGGSKVSDYAVLLRFLPKDVQTDGELYKYVQERLTVVHPMDIVSTHLLYDSDELVRQHQYIQALNRQIIWAQGQDARLQWEGKRAKMSWTWQRRLPFLVRRPVLKILLESKDQAVIKYEELRREFSETWKLKATGTAIVVFATQESAANCINESAFTLNFPTKAPEHGDIVWSNVGSSSRISAWGRQFTVTLLLIGFLILVSTPAIGFGLLGALVGGTDSFLFAFLPSLVVFLIAIVIPRVVERLTWYEGLLQHSTNEYKNYRRTFILLIVATLLLPSVYISGIAVIDAAITGGSVADALLDAFGMNAQTYYTSYLIHQAFLGNLIQLFRHGLTAAVWRSATTAYPEESLLRQERQRFPFSRSIPFACSVCAVAITYGLISPIILALGFLFIVIRSGIDNFLVTNFFLPGDMSSYADSLGTYRKRIHLICRLFCASAVVGSLYMFLLFVAYNAPNNVIIFSAAVFAVVTAYVVLAFRGVRLFQWLSCQSKTTFKYAPEAVCKLASELHSAYVSPYLADLEPYRYDVNLRKVKRPVMDTASAWLSSALKHPLHLRLRSNDVTVVPAAPVVQTV